MRIKKNKSEGETTHSESHKSTTSTKDECVRYVDMTQEELNECIVSEQEFADRQGVDEWDVKRLGRVEERIKRQKSLLQEKKEEYLNSIKSAKKYLKEEEKEREYLKDLMKQNLEFNENRLSKVKVLKSIRDNLKENPDYYKEVEE